MRLVQIGVQSLRGPDGSFLPSEPIYREMTDDEATLYFAIAGIWDLPYGEQIVGTITAIDTFLGALLGIASSKYKKESEE